MNLNAVEELNDIIDRFKKNNVYFCQFWGVRSTFGLLPDYREEFLLKRINQLPKDIDFIQSLLKQKVTDEQTFELKCIEQSLRTELFTLKETQPHKKLVNAYIEPISNIITVYASRSYAPLDDRIQDIINHERAIPDFLQSALDILDKKLSKPLLNMGVGFLNGINAFLKNELPDIVGKSSNEKLKDEWESANKQAIISIENFITNLKDVYLPVSIDDFKLGEKKFLELLEVSEGIKVTTKQLLSIAENDLEENYSKLQKLLKKEKPSIMDEIKDDYPEPTNLIAECQEIVNKTKFFLQKSKLVTLPADDDCQVVETPEFKRSFGIASMNLPGLGEPSDGKETYFYITPPDVSWDQEQTSNFMKNFSRGSLHVTTIHEVFPGHFVQGLYYQYVIKSPIIRLFSFSISIMEGWAHYQEELIVDKGYDGYDITKVKIGQLLSALKRNVRFICAVKMHCMDMTLEEATNLFKDKAMLSQESAQMEAFRGTVDPMYLNYTLGKLMIKKLKSDLQKEQGKKFNERNFHDSILKLGMPPIPLLREYLLKKTSVEEYL